MSLYSILSSLLLGSTLLAGAHASVVDDFTGTGHILVLNSTDFNTATPAQQVGCIDDDSRFIAPTDSASCGTFTRASAAPYNLVSM